MMTPQLPLTTLSALLETQQHILTMLERIAVAVEQPRDEYQPKPCAEGQLVSIKEAAHQLGCHPQTLWRKLKKRQYPYYMAGRVHKVNVDEILSIMKQHQGGGSHAAQETVLPMPI